MREAAKNRREELGPQSTRFRRRKRWQIVMLTMVLTAPELDLGKLGIETNRRRAKDTKRRKDKCNDRAAHKQPHVLHIFHACIKGWPSLGAEGG